MIDLIIFLFLLFFSITDISYHRVPNEMVIMMAAAGVIACGYTFIIIFTVCILVLGRIRIRGRTLFGGGDIKVISILTGMLGISETLIILFISFILSIISFLLKTIISQEDLKTGSRSGFSFMPYLLGGFLCAGLLHL